VERRDRARVEREEIQELVERGVRVEGEADRTDVAGFAAEAGGVDGTDRLVLTPSPRSQVRVAAAADEDGDADDGDQTPTWLTAELALNPAVPTAA